MSNNPEGPTTSRAAFIAWAARTTETREAIPKGWWGHYNDVRGPRGVRMHCMGNARGWIRSASCSIWVLSVHGRVVSKHDSRKFAMSKARLLAKARAAVQP